MTAPLPSTGIVRIDAVRCEEHGDILPEMIVVPFSLDAALLRLLPFVCGACAEEDAEAAYLYPPAVEWTAIAAPMVQHWGDVGYDPDARPSWYPIWHARPVARTEDGDPIYRLGRLKQADGTYRTANDA